MFYFIINLGYLSEYIETLIVIRIDCCLLWISLDLRSTLSRHLSRIAFTTCFYRIFCSSFFPSRISIEEV